MKDQALRLALEALNDRASQMKWQKAREAVEQALEQERALQALHDENERLGLYKDAYGQPEPVIDKSAAIRIATSLGWTPKREWQGLTDEEIKQIEETTTCMGNESWLRNLTRNIEAKLKEKNT